MREAIASIMKDDHDAAAGKQTLRSRVFVICGRGADAGKLEQFFANRFGAVVKMKSDVLKGIAWVTFANEADAAKAVLAFPAGGKKEGGDDVVEEIDLDDGMKARRFTVVFSEEQPTQMSVSTTTTTTTTTTTATSSMLFANNNQMNELPEGSRLFVVTPKDCTDDVLNKAVLKV